MERIQSALGLAVMIGLLVLFSANRRAIRWRIVAYGLGLQFTLGLLILHTDAGQFVFSSINQVFRQILRASESGASFVFGPMADQDGNYLPVGEVVANGQGGSDFVRSGKLVAETGFVFAWRALPPIIFFSALMSVGYYLGVMQFIVRGVARGMAWTLKTSGAETMSAAANIFVGQTEAPLMVKPYVERMTRSELMAIMVGGFATTAGGILVVYMSLLEDVLPNVGSHLITCSVLTAPASLMMAKLAIPETETSVTAGDVKVKIPNTDANVVDAAAQGTIQGLKLALNVGAMLIVFLAIVALVDIMLGGISSALGAARPWTLAMVFGKLFYPVAWLLGVPAQDCSQVGHLLGYKSFLNELVAYNKLAHTTGLQDRSYRIASYALCGFANIGSIGIQLGGIGAIAPSRQHDLARLGVRAMIVGSMATFSAACVVGILTN